MKYFEFDHVDQYTDANGVWQWDEAPTDEIQADIVRPGEMQLRRQPMTAREEPYVFTVPKALVISGSVVDAATQEPIEKFRITPGIRTDEPGYGEGVQWTDNETYESTGGKYRIRITRAYPAHLVRIAADGYKVAISREFKPDQGDVNYNFRLEPAEDIAATILAPDGQPAAGAKIAVGLSGSQINVKNGDIDDGGTYAPRLDADSEGHFSIPPRDDPFQLVITHPAGFAYIRSADGAIEDPIRLTAWARIEGTFRIGEKIAPNIDITMNTESINEYTEDGPHIFSTYDVTTGQDGRFAWGRVFPGKARIGRRLLLMVGDGAVEATSSQMWPIELTAGETTTLNLGGTGRAVVGKLAPPAGFTGRPLWNLALMHVEPDLERPQSPEVPEDLQDDPEAQQAWWQTWRQSDEGHAWQEAYSAYRQRIGELSYFHVSVDREGAFRIDDVAPGDYVLNVSPSEPNAAAPGVLRDFHFSVPPIAAGDAPSLLDLGVLQLEAPEPDAGN